MALGQLFLVPKKDSKRSFQWIACSLLLGQMICYREDNYPLLSSLTTSVMALSRELSITPFPVIVVI